MFKLFEYYGRFQGFRGRVIELPAWSRALLFVAALPGILLLSLSILLFLVSLSALLVLTVPLYRLFRATLSPREMTAGKVEVTVLSPEQVSSPPQPPYPTGSGVRRQIDVKIIE